MPTYAIVIVLVAMPVVFVGFWSLVCGLLALVGGWAGLARRFRTEAEEPPGAEGGLFGMVGPTSYRGVLQVGFAEDGLDLRVMALFRPGHPPLRIPWSAIRMEGEGRGLFGSSVRLRIGEGGPLLRLPGEVWARRPGAR